ncbi:helix-turn-helix domain-containing protein [Bacillus sp. Marseille-P3661]|uniref:helix-turn-helix domain-containing protein n=1 Tax=Bacillus sp. Marseille-P3661 TaxID=1936234 RepID=UPI002155BDAB|nr:RodZ domain-containing protein [Bacillus sp. Marseille-P3661]
MLLLTELGKRLEEARVQKKLTLDELQTITKIQKRYLKAIEDGNYDILPGKFYARAFIKQYAEAVDLDPDMLFDEFVSEIPKSGSDVPSGLSRVHSKQATVSSTSSAVFSMLPKVLVFCLVIGVAIFIWVFMQKQDVANNSNDNSPGAAVESQEDESVTIVTSPEKIEEPKESTEEEQDSEPEPQVETTTEEIPPPVQQLVQTEQTNGTTPNTTYELKNTDVFKMDVTATQAGRSYVGIKNGIGKSFFAGEMKNGETASYDFSSEQEIELNIGRTLDVEIKINGQPFEYPIPPADKVHQKVKFIFNKEIQ